MLAYINTGRPFQIDEQDEEIVSQYRWYDINGYVKTLVGRNPRRVFHIVKMLLGNAPDGLVWDHANRDRFDNRRANIRAVTFVENSLNRSINYGALRCDNVSGVNGVYWNTKERRWKARLIFEKKTIHIGSFIEIQDAMAARRAAEKRYWPNIAENA